MTAQKRYAIGLDVSTSCTGICILDRDIEPDSVGSHIVLLEHEPFKKCKTVWEKADVITMRFHKIATTHYCGFKNFDIFVEEALLGFRPGLSSATTIASLLRFNGIVSYIARSVFEVEPQFVSASHARKVCGIKLQKTAIGGPQKEQVFKYMSQNDLKHVVWPLKKDGVKIIDGARDATDAYVIARAGTLMNK